MTVTAPKFTANYLQKLGMSMPDKVWFLWEIEELEDKPICYLDFGCADGALLEAVHHVMGEEDNVFLGYDILADFLIKAKKRKIPHSFFSINRQEVFERALNFQMMGYKVVLILSSVLHEIQSYSSLTEVMETHELLWGAGFDYIAIRDMAITEQMERMVIPLNKKRNAIKVLSQLKKVDNPYFDQFESFIKKWGGLYRYKGWIHWMLKYPYQEHWQRELNENYLVVIEDIQRKINTTRLYDMIHWEHFSLPYIKKRVKEDFSVDFDEHTHIKLLYRLK